MCYGKCGRNMVHKIHKKLLKKLYISAYTDASVMSSGTCSITNNWEAKAVNFYHYPAIQVPMFKGKNFHRIYMRWILPSFWSKEKDYSGFIQTRQYTVFTTNHCPNRGLFIPVYSVWYIYNICAIQYRFEWLSFSFDPIVFFARFT